MTFHSESLGYCGSVPEFDEAGKIAMREKAKRNGGIDFEAHGTKSDEWIADRVRMLSRNDIDHEAICCAARDRIMRLTLRVAELKADTICRCGHKRSQHRLQCARHCQCIDFAEVRLVVDHESDTVTSDCPEVASRPIVVGNADTMSLEDFKAYEPLYDQALQFAKAEPTMSVSKMQRHFRLGYNRAARLCERLAADGVLIFNRTTGSWSRA